MKTHGYIVMDWCDNYEQVLALRQEDHFPPGGLLAWSEGRHLRTVFASRKDALAAISRTEHFRLAFGADGWPEKKNCRVVPVSFVAAQEGKS